MFISYSRADSAYVQRLQDGLRSRGKDVWVDVEGVRDAELFPLALRRAIETSDAFVFVISPESVRSPFCEQEVAHARELNKRIVPMALHPVPDDELPGEIRFRNWIPAGEDGGFESTLRRLISALEADLEWEHQHTRLTVKALEWDQAGRDRSFLLRGSELAAAERWLADGAGRDPGPTVLEQEYLLAARAAASLRQRVLVGASLAVAVISIGLLVFALISRGQAVSAKEVATSRALAAQSENELAVDPQLSILLAIRAVGTSPTRDALFALRAAIDGSPLRMALLRPAQAGCQLQIGPSLAYDPSAPRLAEGLCSGKLVIGRRPHGRILVFDSRTGRVVQRLMAGLGGAPALAYSPDGSVLAAGTLDQIQLFDARTGTSREVLGAAPGPNAHAELTNALVFSPNASQLAVISQTQAKLWSPRRHTVLTLEGKPFPAGSAVSLQPGMHSAAFTSDGQSVVVAGDNGVRVFRAGTGALLRTLPGTSQASAVAMSRDGRELAVASSAPNQGVVTIWDVRTWKLSSTLARFPGGQITALAFSADSNTVAIGAADGSAGLWSVRTGGAEVAYVGSTSPVASIAFATKGDQVATASTDGTTNVWRASGPELASIYAGGTVYGAQLNGDHVTAAIAPDVVRSWSLPDGIAQPAITARVPGSPEGLVLSPGGALSMEPFAAQPGGPASGVDVRSTWTGALLRTIAAPGTLSAVAVSPDGRKLALIADQSRIVELATGRGVTLAALPGPPTAASGCQWAAGTVSRDDRLVAGADFCGQVVIWDARTGRIRTRFTNQGEVSHIAFSPDGRHLAVGSWNSKITIWDVVRSRAAHVLTGDTLGVDDVAYSPDGALLASSSLDDTARVWDPSSGRLLRVWREQQPLESVAFSVDGSKLVTADAAGTIRVWDACTACGNAGALLAIARNRVTRQLTSLERATFLGG